MITTRCFSCGNEFAVPEDAGQDYPCPRCCRKPSASGTLKGLDKGKTSVKTAEAGQQVGNGSALAGPALITDSTPEAGQPAGTKNDSTPPPNNPSGPTLITDHIVVKPPEGAPKVVVNSAMEHHLGYQVLEELGRGGMGVVYKARQLGLNRVVALKMVLAGEYASPQQKVRFMIEGETIARLQHPNIVQIFEVGTHDSRPFFAMEFVKGGSLAGRLDGRSWPHREAAIMTHQIASAMQYAHSLGIIHRDLKPANILLTEEDAPKITDFGLAKNLEGDSGLTSSGAIMGTPSYMAPEQASGDTRNVGTSADVYAIGVILYQLLTGRLPFESTNAADLILQVLIHEPASVSTIQPKVPRDLVTICMRCLEKEPEKRYSTAGALSEDLWRFLNFEPVQARRVGELEKAWRWARRRPMLAALVGVSFLAVVTVLIGSLWFNVLLDNEKREVKRQRDEANLQRQLAEEGTREALHQRQLAEDQRRRAEENFQHARDAVDQMLVRVGQERLINEPRMEKVRRDLLKKALEFYKGFLQAKSTDPAVRFETGRAYFQVADIQEMLGQYKPAIQAFASAAMLFEELVKAFPEKPDYRQYLASSLNRQGVALQATGRAEDAEKAFQESLAIKTHLVTDFPGAPEYRFDLGKSYHDRAILMQTHNKLREAEAASRQALDVFAILTAEYPTVADYQLLRSRSYTNLSALLQATGRAQESVDACRRSVDLLTPLAARFPKVPEYHKDLANSVFNLGVLLEMGNQPADAEKSYAQAIDIFGRLTAQYPSVPDYRHGMALSFNNLSGLLHALKKTREAEQAGHQAHGLLEKLAQEFPTVPIYRQELARGHNEFGIFLASTNRAQEAEESWNKALAVQEKLVADFPGEPAYRKELATSHGNLANLLIRGKRLTKGEEHYSQAVDILEKLEAQYPAVSGYWQELATDHTNLAQLQTALRRLPEAETHFRRAAVLQKRLVAAAPQIADNKIELGRILHDLADVLLERTKLVEARSAIQDAIRNQEWAVQADRQRAAFRLALGDSYLTLGEIEVRLGNHTRAAGAVKELAGVIPGDWAKRDRAAGLLARCIPLVEKDEDLADSERQRLAKEYAAQALSWLHEAAASGYKDAEYLKKTPDFDPLRARKDFQKLLADLEMQTGAPKE